MYTILIDSDNTMRQTVVQNIVCRSKLVDKLHFLTAQTYGEYDMSQFTVTLEYKLPISKEYHTETLKLSDALYKDEWLEYILPFDTALTKEAGEIEILITFTAAVANEETGEITQYVRKIEPTTITIAPLPNWADLIPDSALSALDQRLIALQAVANNLNQTIIMLDNEKADNIAMDDNEVYLTANGNKIGDSITINVSEVVAPSEVPVVNI